jgi:hypothetical protein
MSWLALWHLVKSPNGLIGIAICSAGLMLYSYGQSRVAHGVQKERSRQEKIDDQSAKRGADAAAATARPGPRRMLDPYTRHDQ